MDVPDNAGIAAAQGTLCHTICELILTDQSADAYSVGSTHTVDGFEIEVTDELWALIEWALEKARSYDDALEVRYEYRVDLERTLGVPHQKGTADIVAIYPEYVVVSDFKFGYLDVSPERNEQEMLYMAGVVDGLDLWHLDRFCVSIIQPRSHSFKEYWFDRAELLAFVEKAREAVKNACMRDAVRTPDPDTCEWCPIRGSCKARAKQVGEFMMEASDDQFDPQRLTTEQLGLVLAYRKTIETFLKDAFDELTRRLVQEGEDPPEGWEIALGRQGNRAYIAIAEDELRDWYGFAPEVYSQRTLLTPPNLETAVKKLGLPKAVAEALVNRLTTRSPARRVVKRVGAEVEDFSDVFDFE
jgi:hypothetical protein